MSWHSINIKIMLPSNNICEKTGCRNETLSLKEKHRFELFQLHLSERVRPEKAYQSLDFEFWLFRKKEQTTETYFIGMLHPYYGRQANDNF